MRDPTLAIAVDADIVDWGVKLVFFERLRTSQMLNDISEMGHLTSKCRPRYGSI